jgi:hypothetical protein
MEPMGSQDPTTTGPHHEQDESIYIFSVHVHNLSSSVFLKLSDYSQ